MPEQQPSKKQRKKWIKTFVYGIIRTITNEWNTDCTKSGDPLPRTATPIRLLRHSPPLLQASLQLKTEKLFVRDNVKKELSIRSPLLSTLLCCLSFQVTLSLLLLRSWKNDFIASYVDQQMAAAGVWNSILGTHPLISPPYPSFFSIV